MRSLALFRRQGSLTNAPSDRTVTVILAAHNEEQRIAARLLNILASDYPPDRLNIVVVSDGSTDGTVANARAITTDKVQVIVGAARAGKVHCLNRGVAASRAEVIVFADVRQRFAPDTIRNLVQRFDDPQVGAVSGALEIDQAGSSVGRGVDLYWRMEKALRFSEAQFDSSIGCTGAVYAIKRSLFKPLPTDTLLDDVVIPMQIALQGFRVLFEPGAVAYDPQSLEPDRERVRKQRTLAGNYQMLFRHPGWLLPWRNRVWWQLASHKYLRLLAPFLLVLAFAANAFLRGSSLFYQLLFLCQSGFYLCAMIGMASSKRTLGLFSVPAGFVFLNAMSVSALVHYLRGSYRQGSWPKAHC